MISLKRFEMFFCGNGILKFVRCLNGHFDMIEISFKKVFTRVCKTMRLSITIFYKYYFNPKVNIMLSISSNKTIIHHDILAF